MQLFRENMKKVLVLCTGNSCRSIIAEALINAFLKGVSAKSAGVNAKGKVNENAKKVLEKHGIWSEEYYSKNIDEVIDEDFDLVVTVCENAKETCPVFPKKTKTIHIGFEDPDGKEFEAFEKTYKEIKTVLLPKIKKVLEQI
jgi:arsenate reductase